MPTSATTGNRNDRRRAATRQALVRAARQILAETGDTSVSIQFIAERADVGFGSFYNHFESKAQLFDAAVADVLEEFGSAFDAHLSEVQDPAELVSGGFRLSARMVDSNPEAMRILCDRARGHLHSEGGLAPRARRDVNRGIAEGRFLELDPLIALTALGGAMLGLVELRFSHPEIDGDRAAAELAEMLLRSFGLTAEEAAEVARRPLPELR
ncbi:TetR/AcrR family transcriptional regulator [Saccharopolyspora sp. MS10]|uniref:TetR/AcrR family transcriptional regulator n=1 Tax=Saccharopolyspora sp. MS10 TaxID=3385973 RepID=UPI0039A268C2